jgi:hypothetical protein
MRELIYKDEAYKAIDNCFRDGWYRISPADAKMNIRHLVSDVSEADRPQGEWIYTMNPLRLNDEWECSKCGYLSFAKVNYCGHCGCRMKGADNE